MNFRLMIFTGAVLAALGVSLGAMGAHALEDRVAKGTVARKQFEQYDTAVRYQMYHALGLILLGVLAQTRPSCWLSAAAVAMICGCVLFSGGLYGYVASVIVPLPRLGFLKHVIPFGGGLFIASWVLLAWGSLMCGRSTK